MDREAVLSDFQLLKRVSNNFFKRIRDRNPALSECLHRFRLDFVERSVKDDKDEIRAVTLGGPQRPIDPECKSLQILLTDDHLKVIYNDMKQYMEDVQREHARISEFFTDTIKELKISFKMMEHRDYINIVTVGSLDSASQYSVRNSDHCMDLVIWNSEY